MNNNGQREQEIFKTALGLGKPKERRGFVQGACGEDQELREKVEALLAGARAPIACAPSCSSRLERFNGDETARLWYKHS